MIRDFLVMDDELKKLLKQFEEAKKLILTSIKEGRKIIIRHDSDCDGYAGGLALESAILSLIKEIKNTYKIRNYYRRLPNRTPFYAYSDASRDAMEILNSEQFSKKSPLFILVDFGCGMENELSLKKIKKLGSKVLIVDHHIISKNILGIPSVILNPCLYADHTNLSSGMIAAELSTQLVQNDSVRLFGAISGITDKSPLSLIKKYAGNANIEQLAKLAKVIDFEASYSKFFEGTNTIDVLFENDKRSEELVKLVYPKIMELRREQLETLKNHHEKIGSLFIVDVEKYCSREYPSTGRSIGLLTDHLKNKHKKLTVLGVGSSFMIIRTNKKPFLPEILSKVENKFPNAMISGGGHAPAGVINYLPGYKNEVLTYLKTLLK